MAVKTELTRQFRQNYLEHWPTDTYIEHEFETDLISISILEVPNVMPGCKMYFSLGLSSYFKKTKFKGELYTSSTDEWDLMPTLLGNLLINFIDHEIPIIDGRAIGRIDKVMEEFVLRTGKSAIYFTVPMGIPQTLGMLHLASRRRYLTMGVFISESEYEFLEKHGTNAFEEKMEAKNVDPFEIRRTPAI